MIAVNRMAADYPGELWASATLHPDIWGPIKQQSRREVALFAPQPYHGVDFLFPHTETISGTSALYAVRIALALGGADRIVLAGCPLDDGPHYDSAATISDCLAVYRDGWRRALPELRNTVRSLSGWTRELLGEPTDEWLASEAIN